MLKKLFIILCFSNHLISQDYKIEEYFHKSMRDSWSIKKTISKVMTNSLNEQYESINNLIPNNWIRLIGAGSGGYFLISSSEILSPDASE